MSGSRVGIIGCGNMGGGLARGMLSRNLFPPYEPLVLHSRSDLKVRPLEVMGARACSSVAELAEQAAYIILAVKPYQIAALIREAAPALTPRHTLVSVAAGVTLAEMRKAAPKGVPVVRVMPNTLVSVGRGQFGLCLDDGLLTDERRRYLRDLFGSLGQVMVLPESRINAFAALAGCGPAYVFQIADAFIEAGVTMGLGRAEASDLVFGLFAGCAEMAAQSGLHPAVLREQVTSPGGQTIAGANHLDRTAVRGHIIDAVLAAMRRGLEMEQENA